MNVDGSALSGVPETMLQTVCARARESARPNGVICDPKAEEVVARLDYDFSLAEGDRVMGSGVIARTILLDRMVKSFLAKKPDAVVVNLACGLDTRYDRLDNGRIRWYDLDLPETMAVRSALLPPEGRVTQIAKSAMDESWPLAVEAGDRPVLVVIEGLSMYLAGEDVQKIFAILAEHFPNATVFLEIMSPLAVRFVKEKSIEGSHARFTWGVWSGRELERQLPDWSVTEERSLTEGMAAFLPVYRLLGKLPPVRRLSNRIMVLKRRI